METVEKIIRELKGRGNFDHWWDEIDAEIQDEIKESLEEIINTTVSDTHFCQFSEGCGLEDLNIQDRYEAMEYGWRRAIEAVNDNLNS